VSGAFVLACRSRSLPDLVLCPKSLTYRTREWDRGRRLVTLLRVNQRKVGARMPGHELTKHTAQADTALFPDIRRSLADFLKGIFPHQSVAI
jgi:hypothetical protein